jgi:hypothetical protein
VNWTLETLILVAVNVLAIGIAYGALRADITHTRESLCKRVDDLKDALAQTTKRLNNFLDRRGEKP